MLSSSNSSVREARLQLARSRAPRARSVRSGVCDLRLRGRVTGWQLCVAFERRHQRLTCLACRFAASQVHLRAMGTGSAPAPFPVINRKPTLGATLRNFTFGDLCSMFGCTVAGGVWGFAAGALMPPRSSAPCTTWLVAFALNLPASLVPPSSRSPPAARSFACRRQAPSMPNCPLALYTSFDRRTVRVCVIILPHRLLHTECARRGVRPQSESRMIALPYSTQLGLS